MTIRQNSDQELVPFALMCIEGQENGPSNLLYAKELLGDAVELQDPTTPSLRGITTAANIAFMRERLFPDVVEVVTFENEPEI